MNKTKLIALGLVLATLLAAVPVVFAFDSEPNDAFSQAESVGEGTYEGKLIDKTQPDGEPWTNPRDYFVITLNAEEQLKVVFTETAGDYRLSIFHPSSFDGTKPIGDPDRCNPQCLSCLATEVSVTADVDGGYYIRVGREDDTNGAYTLTITKEAGAPGAPDVGEPEAEDEQDEVDTGEPAEDVYIDGDVIGTFDENDNLKIEFTLVNPTDEKRTVDYHEVLGPEQGMPPSRAILLDNQGDIELQAGDDLPLSANIQKETMEGEGLTLDRIKDGSEVLRVRVKVEETGVILEQDVKITGAPGDGDGEKPELPITPKDVVFVAGDYTCDDVFAAAGGVPSELKYIRIDIQYAGCIFLKIVEGIIIVLAALILAVAGVRWIMTESPEEKNKTKRMIINVVIGAIIFIVAVHLANVLVFNVKFETLDCDSIKGESDVSLFCSKFPDKTVGDWCRDELNDLIGGLGAVCAALPNDVENKNLQDYCEETLAGVATSTECKEKATGLCDFIGGVPIVGPQCRAAILGMSIGGKTIEEWCDEIFPEDAASLGVEEITANINFVACVLFTVLQGIAAIVALVVIILAGVRWMSSDDPEVRDQAKKMIVGAVIGFIILVLASEFAGVLFFGDDLSLPSFSCDIPGEANVDKLIEQVEDVGCLIFITVFIVSATLAALIIVMAAIQWIASDSPEDRNRAKSWFIRAIIGFVVVMVASQFIWALTTSTLGGFSGGIWDIILTFLGVTYLETCLLKVITHGSIWLFIVQLHLIFCIFIRMAQAVAVVVAAAIITIAGLSWIGSDVPEKRQAAKDRIVHAIVGLTIALVALSIIDAASIIGGVLDLLGVVIAIPFSWACPSWAELGAEYFVTQVQHIGCVFIRILQGITAMIAAIVIILAGIKYTSSESIEERIEAKERIKWAVLGIILIGITLQLLNLFVDTAFSGFLDLASAFKLDCGDISGTGVVEEAEAMGCVIVRILQASAAIIAAIVIILAGFKWMSYDSPEERSKAKSYIAKALVGLLIVVIALELVNAIVNNVSIGEFDLTCSIEDLPEELRTTIQETGCNIIQILQVGAGFVAALVIVFAGLIWVGAGDSPADRYRAREIIIAAIIGLVVIIIAMQIVNYTLTGNDILQIACE